MQTRGIICWIYVSKFTFWIWITAGLCQFLASTFLFFDRSVNCDQLSFISWLRFTMIELCLLNPSHCLCLTVQSEYGVSTLSGLLKNNSHEHEQNVIILKLRCCFRLEILCFGLFLGWMSWIVVEWTHSLVLSVFSHPKKMNFGSGWAYHSCHCGVQASIVLF